MLSIFICPLSNELEGMLRYTEKGRKVQRIIRDEAQQITRQNVFITILKCPDVSLDQFTNLDALLMVEPQDQANRLMAAIKARLQTELGFRVELWENYFKQ